MEVGVERSSGERWRRGLEGFGVALEAVGLRALAVWQPFSFLNVQPCRRRHRHPAAGRGGRRDLGPWEPPFRDLTRWRDTRRAMSRENVEIVRRWIEAFNRGGLEEAIRFLDPEIEWTTTSAYLEAGTYQGHEGVRHFVRNAAAAWEDLRIEPEKLIGAGDQVVVPLRIKVRGKQSRSQSVFKLTVLASLQGGKIVRIRDYTNKADALEAVGLRE
jgi:ketosteroid isomerase-like protein